MPKESRQVHFTVRSSDGTRFRVESDRFGYCITRRAQRQNQSTGEVTWEWYVQPSSFYGSFEGVCRRLLELGLREIDAASVTDLISQMTAWRDTIVTAIAKMDGYPRKGEKR